jgi:hypothetical protein
MARVRGWTHVEPVPDAACGAGSGVGRRLGRKMRPIVLDTSGTSDIPPPEAVEPQEEALANHLTPTELADEVQMQRQEVIAKCVEMGIPIFHGRIDKTLFMASLRHTQQLAATKQQAA